MSFYIRKSVRVGPLRFNLSKSGIGVSTGIPGLRVGAGPRGTYVHMGRGGLYYRQTLSSPTLDQHESDNHSVDAPVDSQHTHGPMNVIESGSIAEMIDTNSVALLSEIEQKRKRIVFWPFMLVLSLLFGALLFANDVTSWLSGPCILTLFAVIIFVHQYDQLKKNIVIMYELDGENLNAYQKLYSSVNEIARCSAVWHFTAQGEVYDSKYHAGAGKLIKRGRVSINFRDPPYIKTRSDPRTFLV